MKSTWLKEYTQVVKEKQEKRRGENKKTIIIWAVICLVLIGIAFAVGVSQL